MQEQDRIKVGFIGFGRMAEGHARQLRETGKFAPTAVCDVTPARAKQARDLGMTATDVLDSFLESDVDLVFVTTNSASHHELALAALRAGKNVVVEKPMAMNGREAAEMVQAARDAGRMLTVFHNRRWDSDYRRVKKAVRDGVIGEPFLVENRTAGSGPAVGFGVPEFRQEWRVTRAMGGGTIYDFGPHWIDQVLDLIPSRVVQVFAEVKHLKWGDADDFFDIHMRFANGCRATASKCDVAYVSWPKWIVLGTEGSIKHDQETLVRTADRAYFELNGVPSVSLYENYFAHLREGAELLVKSEEGMRVMQVIDAAFESATQGRSVEVDI
jgi:scyllo-inositol 2-dehydrogenase (NADP+)